MHEITCTTAARGAAAAAVAVAKADRTLEHVVLFRRRVRCRMAKQTAQVDDEALRTGEFGCHHALPADNEGLDGIGGRGAHDGGIVAGIVMR